jgi:hypothetical protein
MAIPHIEEEIHQNLSTYFAEIEILRFAWKCKILKNKEQF